MRLTVSVSPERVFISKCNGIVRERFYMTVFNQYSLTTLVCGSDHMDMWPERDEADAFPKQPQSFV